MQVAVVRCVDAPNDPEGMRPSPTCRPEAGWLDAPTDSEGVEAIADRLGHCRVGCVSKLIDPNGLRLIADS